MFPTFQLGPWQVNTYATVYAVALLVAGSIAFFRLLRLEAPIGRLTPRLLLVILGAVAGTYVVGVIPTLVQWARTGRLAWSGEASFVGTLAGGITVTFLVFRHSAFPMGRACDLGGQPWSLLQAIGRIGCMAAGCCGGKPTTSWLGMRLPDEAGQWAVRYPTQLMSGVLNLLIFLLLIAVERYGWRRVGRDRGWPFNGFLFLLYICLFCIERFSMEFMRADHVPLVGPLSWIHLATLAGFLTAAGLIAWNLVRSRAGGN